MVGDPFAATTHTDLQLRARRRGVAVSVVHNASVMNAVAACGLQLYRFGQAVSICFFTSTWRPDSFYERVASNRAAGLHTLCLLDIRVREPTEASLARGRPVYEPPRYMTAQLAAEQLLEVEASRGGGGARPLWAPLSRPGLTRGAQSTPAPRSVWRWRGWGSPAGSWCAPRWRRWRLGAAAWTWARRCTPWCWWATATLWSRRCWTSCTGGEGARRTTGGETRDSLRCVESRHVRGCSGTFSSCPTWL